MSALSDVVSFADACARGASDTQLLALGSAIVKAARKLSKGQAFIAGQDAMLFAGAQLLADKTVEHDALYARCPVLESDITPDHTATAIETFALANGWVEAHGDNRRLLIHPNAPDYVHCVARGRGSQYYDRRSALQFCRAHAAATNTPPLDVLQAIGACAPDIVCPTCDDAKPGQCCQCPEMIARADQVLESNPYASEICNDEALHLECDSCRERAAQEV